MKRGFCVIVGANPDLFYEDGYETIAKAYCQRCRVVTQCLEWALNHNENGIWGGTTEPERRALKRGGERRSCPGCLNTLIFTDDLSNVCVSCGLSWLT
jgi:WhiB family redox-sensing transcriptional regulator